MTIALLVGYCLVAVALGIAFGALGHLRERVTKLEHDVDADALRGPLGDTKVIQIDRTAPPESSERGKDRSPMVGLE